MKKCFLAFFLVSLLATVNVHACTNFIVTKGASADGSVFLSYSADSHVLFGELYHWPAATWPEGAMLDVYEWDTGKFMGRIRQARETYNVVGNINEYQVGIGETTYGGLGELGSQSGAIMDYGSLIYIALQRSKSAREAMKVITELMDEYGYASSGESFSITDPNEAWIFEMIGKGEGQKGAVWVGLRIPDGYVSAHANQARITTFPLADGKRSVTFSQRDKLDNPDIECFYADDVISFAREKGLFKGQDREFSFSDVYAPIDFSGARFCEVRVWSFFKSVNKEMEKYFDYASGRIHHEPIFADGTPNPNGYATNRMPLWVRPDQKVSLHDVMNYMRDHLEGTPLDMTVDAGAGPYGSPYRWRPLTWTVDSVVYCNERATATQQTGFVFVTQSRSWIPNPIGGIIWWGVDDASSSIFMPMYACMTKSPEKMAVGYGSMMEFVDDAAFWVFNQISNFAYTRYNVIHPEIKTRQQAGEENFFAQVIETDKAALQMYRKGKARDREKAVAFLTDYSVTAGNNTVDEWKKFYGYLFTKYMDGNIKEAVEVPEGYIYHVPKLVQPGYPEWFLRIIAETTGEKLKVIGPAH
jgi:dipeptidase